MTRYLVTGGAGFIGFNFVRELLACEPGCEVVVLDKLTYAANPQSLAELAGEPRFTFARGDVADGARVREILAGLRPEIVVHFAAESHVDRSIDSPTEFIVTNVVGTSTLLDECRRYLATNAVARFRFIHISTDEVFGALGADGAFTEASAYAPRSPYAASKAASDHLVAAFVRTYGFPAIVTNCANNYGPYQYPEKLIPLTIANALAGLPLPVYGTGHHVRDWIYVTDHCAALRAVIARGRLGEVYLVGAREQRRNLDVVRLICDLLAEIAPGPRYHNQITYVADRLGHDFRYAIDPTKLERELGWRPVVSFAAGLWRTIAWYLDHRAWMGASRQEGT